MYTVGIMVMQIRGITKVFIVILPKTLCNILYFSNKPINIKMHTSIKASGIERSMIEAKLPEESLPFMPFLIPM